MSEFTQLSNLMRGALKAADGGESVIQRSTKEPQVLVGSAKEAFAKAFAHDPDANAMFVNQTMLPVYKALGTADIAALRLVTITEPTAVIRNDDTVFLNWLQTRPSLTVRDYQMRIKERDAGSTVAPLFNLNDTMPVVHQSTYAARYNTLTTIGNQIKQGMLAKDMAAQQGQDDVAQDEMDDVMSLINRGMNKTLLANTEVTSEAVGQVPQLGGFLTRTVTNVTNEGSTDLSEADLDAAIKEICDVLGWGTQLMLLVHDSQVPVIDDIMINRFPGTDPMTHFQRTNSLLAQQLAAGGFDVKTAYSDRKAKPVPVLMDQQLPANQAILFAANLPRLAEYKFLGKGGFHALVLPEATAYDVSVIFRCYTLSDPLEISRHKFTAVS